MNRLLDALNDLCNWIARTFPSGSKEGDVIVGLFVFMLALFLIVSGIGLVLQLITGIAWWWTPVAGIVFAILYPAVKARLPRLGKRK